MMTPITCGVRSSLSRTQTLIATRSPLWRLEGATSSGRPSTRTRNQHWQTREIAQASIPLRVVGRSCGKFFSQNPDKTRNKKPMLAPNFTEFRLLSRAKTSSPPISNATIQSLKTEPALAHPEGGHSTSSIDIHQKVM